MSCFLPKEVFKTLASETVFTSSLWRSLTPTCIQNLFEIYRNCHKFLGQKPSNVNDGKKSCISNATNQLIVQVQHSSHEPPFQTAARGADDQTHICFSLLSASITLYTASVVNAGDQCDPRGYALLFMKREKHNSAGDDLHNVTT